MTEDKNNDKGSDTYNLTALLDQQGSFLKDLAKPLYIFYVSLVAEGFSADEAMQVLLLYIDKTLPNAPSISNKKE